MHVQVDGEHGVLWTAHLVVLVALTQVVCAWCIAKLTRLHKQLGGILAVDKDNIVDATLMEEGELVEHMGELSGGVLPRALQPLDTLAGALQEANHAVELRNAKEVHGAGV